MSSNVYTSISELYQVDQDIIANVRLLASKQGLIEDFSSKIEFFLHQVDVVAQQLKAIKHQIGECDLESRTIDERLEKDRRDLRNCVEMKVAIRLEHEIEQLEAKRNELDEQLIALWERKADIENELERAKDALQEKSAELKQKIRAIEEEIGHINAQLDEQKQMQQRLIGQIDVWQGPYKDLKERIDDPVASARKGMCTACDVILPKSDQLRLLKHVILRCPECFRLLFTADLQ